MLTELCGELNNYFNRNQPKKFGTFHVSNGMITEDLGLQVGQYYRIIGSVFNDGVHQYTGNPDEDLHDEVFSGGAVWLMAVPKEVVDLAQDIADWQAKYNEVSYSPFTSESLAPTSYSYSVNTGAGQGAGATWQNIFSSRLDRWRKTKP